VLDPEDTVGIKNRLIDRVHKRALARHLGRLRDARVLDFGCGVGRISEWLDANGAQVHGIDTSSEIIAAARRRVSRATFELADASGVDREGRAFHRVVCVYVLQHVPATELTDVLSSLSGVLEPGGALVAVEKVSDGTPEQGWTLNHYRRCFADGGLALRMIQAVRLGYSSVMGTVVHRPLLAGVPFLPLALEWEARRHVDQVFDGGQYADYVFLAEPTSPSR
jgi:ubiquinone/menaquinone biosynthesis C-methylase UbiE